MLSYRKWIPFLLLVLLLGACAPQPAPLPPAPDIHQLNTAIAQTAAAAMLQTQQAASPTFTSTATATDTATPLFTLTSTSTPTLTIPTDFATSTPEVAQIVVSVSTNCRSGPGKVYAYRSALSAGVVSEVLAVDPTGNYWYIPNPESPGNFCWVWGEYATLSGNTAALPVYTPPPSPSPTFTLEPAAATQAAAGGSGGSSGSGGGGSGGDGYGPRPTIKIDVIGLDSCSGEWWVEFNLTNVGEGFNLRSNEIILFDSDTKKTVSRKTDGFRHVDGCSGDSTFKVLNAENSLVVSSPHLDYNPSGHELELTVRACVGTGQGSPCSVKEKIEFVP